MAIDTSFRLNYTYFRSFPLDGPLIERILLPAIISRGRFSKATPGIELPHSQGETPEFIPLREAVLLITDWLESNQNLSGSEREAILKLLNKSSFTQLGKLLRETYYARTKKEALLTDALLDNVARLKEVRGQDLTQTPPRFNPEHTIALYNHTYQEIQKLVARGFSPETASALIPMENGGTTQRIFARIIASNLPRLKGAGNLVDQSPANKPQKLAFITAEFEQIIARSYPEYTPILNYTADLAFQKTLIDLVENVSSDYSRSFNDPDLSRLTSLKLSAASSLPLVMPTARNLGNKIADSLAELNISANDARALAAKIESTLISSAPDDLRAGEIISLAARELGLETASIDNITRHLYNSGFGAALELRTADLRSALPRLTPSERSLLKRGIDPTLAGKSTSALRKNAIKLAEKLGLDPKSLPEAGPELELALAQHLENAKSSGKSPHDLYPLSTWLDHAHTSFHLEGADARLARRGRIESGILNTVSRAREIESALLDRLYEIEENLPWNKGLTKLFESWNRLAERAVLTIPLPQGKKLELPLLRLNDWLFDSFDAWKRHAIDSLFTKSSAKWKSGLEWLRKPLNWSLGHYRLGDYSTSGAVYHFARELWSTKVIKPITTWVGKRLTTGIFKYTTRSVARTGTRLFLKIGGKTLAKFGTKAVAALVAAGTAIGSVFSALMAVSMVIDLISVGYEFLREILRNARLRERLFSILLVVGTTLGSWFLALQGGGLAVAAFLMGLPAALATALTAVIALFSSAFFWALGILGSTLLLHNIFNFTIQLDPGQSVKISTGSNYTGQVLEGCIQVPPVTGTLMQGAYTEGGSHDVIEAIDIYVEDGTPVYSARSGVVTFAGWGGVYGNRVDIRTILENGKTVVFIYGHLGSISVSVGQNVEAGKQIGTADSTSSVANYQNPHLHFEYAGGTTNFYECPYPGFDPATIESGCIGVVACSSGENL